MRFRLLLAALLAACLPMLAGCTVFGLAATGASVATEKHGWFGSDEVLVAREEIKKPSIPANVTLSLRYIIQGVDTSKEGTAEESLEWLFKDNFEKQAAELLEEMGLALVTDRGLDGEVRIEVVNDMENFGKRLIPYVGIFRLTETKNGQIRIHLKNRAGREINSGVLRSKVYVQSGLFADGKNIAGKQQSFDIPRTDYTFKGETVALDKLNEQLLLKALKALQSKQDLEEFFSEQDPNAIVMPYEIFEDKVSDDFSADKLPARSGK